MYRIVRHYYNRLGRGRTIATGLTLKEAQAHCADHNASSVTATSSTAKRRTRDIGSWFDGYEEIK